MTNLTKTMVAILTAVAMFGNLNAFAQDRGSSNQSRGGSDRGGPSGGGSSFFDRLSGGRGSLARVTAVADERTNSIIVSAPEEMIAEIDALIAQIEGISSTTTQIRVFALKYAYAKDMATVFTDLYRDTSSGGFSRGGGSSNNSLSRVAAVADERTNSVVVSAPEDIMKTIERIVKEVDTMTEDVTELRVFTLHYANAEETAKIVNDVFVQQQSRSSSSRNQPSAFGRGFGFGGGSSRGSGGNSQSSERRIEEETVVAVADTRTNSVIVKAGGEVMTQIEAMIKNIDANSAKEKKVYVHSLGNANVEEVSTILGQLFTGTQTRSSGSRTGTNTGTSSLRPSSGQTGANSNRRSSGSGTGGTGSSRGGTGGGTGGGGFGSLN